METQRQVQLDPERYARAQELIRAKHVRSPPEVVERLAREAVTRLAALRLNRPFDTANADDARTVTEFCDVLLSDDALEVPRFVQSRFPQATTKQTDIYGLIAAAARQLGSRWDADQVSFVEVTVSVAKLYALLRSMGKGRKQLARNDNGDKSALFASVPGEQHTLGVTIAAELFREAGWDIDLQVGRTRNELVAHALSTQLSAIGLSLYNRTHLQELAQLAEALRVALPNPIIAVAVGGDMTIEALQAAGRFDLVVLNAKQAQKDLAELIQSRRNG